MYGAEFRDWGTIHQNIPEYTVLFFNAAVPSLSDSICRSYLTGIGYQWGGYQAMGTQYKLYPSVPFWQTETECGNGENTWWWADTQYSNRKFAFDSGARAFFEWNMVLEKSGMSSWGWQQSAMISIDTGLKSVTWNPEYYVSKHFSYFIQPGAKYIKTTGTYNNRVAFINPNGDIVIVVRNNQNSACVTGIKIGTWMFLPTIAANSFNTFVFMGLSSPLTSVIPRQEGGNILLSKDAMTDVRIFSLSGKVLFSGRNIRREVVESNVHAFLKEALGGRVARQPVVMVTTNSGSVPRRQIVVP
jgi:hypothetical protein